MAKRQLRIASTQEPRIQEIDDAAEEYREVRDQRMALTKQEGEKKAALLGACERNSAKLVPGKRDDGTEFLAYHFKIDGEEFTVEFGEIKSVKVKKAKDDDEGPTE